MDKNASEEIPGGTAEATDFTPPPRMPVRERVTLTGADSTTLGLLKNLSVSGMYVECDDRFPIGTELEATFSLEQEDATFSLKCRVIHCDRQGIGTAFIHLAPEDEARLTQLTHRPHKPHATPATRELRVHPRVPVRGHITLTSGAQTIHGWVTNLGNGGLFLECDHPFPVEVECELTFTLRDEVLNDPVRILTRCWVAHVNETGMGIQFDELGAATQSELQRAVNAILYATKDKP